MTSALRYMRSMKWELLLYVMVAVLLSLAAGFFSWLYLYYIYMIVDWMQLWGIIAAAVLLIGVSTGYVAALRLQRKVNVLHLGILQLGRGNLTGRIPLSGNDSFDRIYYDFNEMAESVEQRIKLLQRLGEENVRLQASSNEAAVLEERKRLARDLHDTVSQQLFALHMTASTLPKMMERDQSRVLEMAEQLTQMSAIAQKQIRGLIAQLRPVELEGRSLAVALDKWFPDYCRHNNLLGSLDVRLSSGISDALEHQLFMIVQEAMANVVKHAEAKHVDLALHEREHQYILNISDDGKGFYKGKVQTHSYGLSSMQERARKLGGDIEIFSKEGAGTRIKVQIPKFKSEEEEQE